MARQISGGIGDDDSALNVENEDCERRGTTSDSIPAWLSRREFVTNAAATDYYGTDLMYAMNARQIPRDFFRPLGFSNGGSPSGSPSGASAGPAGNVYHVNLEGREALQWVMTHLADGRRRSYQGEAVHV